ncbi:unnamed protein product [Albugo candida]|uniref:Uncharacterized protein n=1 Tax=Albugo candida TaxID=65357 RepID=A0A024GBG7_9STRA|nr:unnamed protein product [Albugo candida]|eukprot:CCI44206.1 unnamed protein product [Albugo candida]
MEDEKLVQLHDVLSRLRPGGRKGGLGYSNLAVGNGKSGRTDGLPDNGLYSMFVREGHNAHLHQRFGDDGDDNASPKKGKKKKKEKKRKKDLEMKESDVEAMEHVSSDSFATQASKRTKKRKKNLEESQVTETQDRTTHKKAKKRSTSMASQVLPLPANELSSKSRTNTKTITKKAKKNKKAAISPEKKKKRRKSHT